MTILKVHDGQDGVKIATASASASSPTSIRLWEWKPPVNDNKQSNKHNAWTLRRIVEGMLKVIIVIAAAAHFLHMIRGQVWCEIAMKHCADCYVANFAA